MLAHWQLGDKLERSLQRGNMPGETTVTLTKLCQTNTELVWFSVSCLVFVFCASGLDVLLQLSILEGIMLTSIANIVTIL